MRRAEVETRNQADSLVFSSEKLLADNADKVPEELKDEVQGKIDAVKTAIASNNTVDIQTATTELNAALQKMGEIVYSQGATTGEGDQDPSDGFATSGQEGDPASSNDDEGTVEGEFREV